MGKEEFRFKQFAIRQDRCAMKVCTDACLFGAIVPLKSSIDHILDIGSGTGLLSLMLAQRSNALIDAVEINEDAANQSMENVAATIWEKRIRIFHQSILDFSPKITYNFIISNPPFFEKSLHSPDASYNLASHDIGLKKDELARVSASLLHSDGDLFIMYPEYESSLFQEAAEKWNLYPHTRIIFRNKPSSKILRVVTGYSFRPFNQIERNEVFIRDEKNEYSEQFKGYLKSYYLIF